MPDDPLQRLLIEKWGLTPRQAEVTTLLAQGLSVKEVAKKSHRSENTIHDHITDVYDKTGIHKQSELVTAVHALMQEAGIKIEKPPE